MLKTVLWLLAVWLLVTVTLGLFDIHIYFPFAIGSSMDIPYHRWQTVRFSTFLTIAFFIIRYVSGSRPVSALAVIDVYIKFMVFVGIILISKLEIITPSEWVTLGFFIALSIGLHRGCKSHRGLKFVKHW